MNFSSKDALDAVEAWARGYLMIRETSAPLKGDQRLDAMLVPISQEAHCMRQVARPFWDRPRLVGVEVKVSRSDFLAGQRRGQFATYDAQLSGLYVAAPAEVCKTADLPAGVGHLIVGRHANGRLSCICRRHPSNFDDRPVAPDVAWRVVFAVRQDYRRRLGEAERGFEMRDLDRRRRLGKDVSRALKLMHEHDLRKGQS